MGDMDGPVLVKLATTIGAWLIEGEGCLCSYPRVLTAKARAGEFSLGPVLMALLRGKAAKASREWRAAGW
jgi:replication initiation protein RepC